MTEKKVHCSRKYHKYATTKLDSFGHGVKTGIYGNKPPFDAPPITEEDFKEYLNVYHDAYEAFKNGGKDQKGAYLTALNNLMEALDKLADYVDGIKDVDEAMITLAGFTPTKIGETKAVIPAAPDGVNADRGGKGVLVFNCNKSDGAEYYGLILLDKPWDNTLFFVDGQLVLNGFTGGLRHITTKGRKKVINSLQSKTEYWAYYYAGNAASVSQLSAAVSIVCD